jgi:GNAT superfamily N-acetyltransferase
MRDSFTRVFSEHGFRYSSSSISSVEGYLARLIADPRVYGVVAELDGRAIGSSFLDERDPVRGLGPVTVDSHHQGLGAGRKLVASLVRRGSRSKGIRLLQDSFNMHSVSLYTSLGFVVREPIILVAGRPQGRPQGAEVRPMVESDLGACNALCRRVHGFNRSNELADQLKGSSPWVALREGRITAYVSNVVSWRTSHGVARTTEDMEAVLTGASKSVGQEVSFLLPIRQSDLFGWCLKNGFRAIQPMTYMSIGFYREPSGCYFPTIHS